MLLSWARLLSLRSKLTDSQSVSPPLQPQCSVKIRVRSQNNQKDAVSPRPICTYSCKQHTAVSLLEPMHAALFPIVMCDIVSPLPPFNYTWCHISRNLFTSLLVGFAIIPPSLLSSYLSLSFLSPPSLHSLHYHRATLYSRVSIATLTDMQQVSMSQGRQKERGGGSDGGRGGSSMFLDAIGHLAGSAVLWLAGSAFPG